MPVTAARNKGCRLQREELGRCRLQRADLRGAGYSCKELKAAGYSTKNLVNAGCSAEDLRCAGYATSETITALAWQREFTNMAQGIAKAGILLKTSTRKDASGGAVVLTGGWPSLKLSTEAAVEKLCETCCE